jgi:hypothetical protein
MIGSELSVGVGCPVAAFNHEDPSIVLRESNMLLAAFVEDHLCGRGTVGEGLLIAQDEGA